MTGVDVSAEQVRRARDAVPEAKFVQADFTTLELEPESFDAVVSFSYAFNHVPRSFQSAIIGRPDGTSQRRIRANVGASNSRGT